jgi:ribosomal protein S1
MTVDVGAEMGVEAADRRGGNAGSGFAELLESYDYQRLRRGQIMEGVVLEASDDEVVVDVGLKRDAFVTSRDLDRLDDEVLDELVPGAEAMVYVLQPTNADGDLIVSVNKALECHVDGKI